MSRQHLRQALGEGQVPRECRPRVFDEDGVVIGDVRFYVKVFFTYLCDLRRHPFVVWNDEAWVLSKNLRQRPRRCALGRTVVSLDCGHEEASRLTI